MGASCTVPRGLLKCVPPTLLNKEINSDWIKLFPPFYKTYSVLIGSHLSRIFSSRFYSLMKESILFIIIFVLVHQLLFMMKMSERFRESLLSKQFDLLLQML